MPAPTPFLLQVAPLTGKGKAVSIVVAVPTLADVFPAVCAVGRAFPFHTTAKTGGPAARVPPKVSVVCAEGPVPDDLLQRCGTAATSIELAAALVDLPPCDFNVGAYVELVDGLSKTVGYECTVHTGAALKEMGLNGLYDVGKQVPRPVLNFSFFGKGGPPPPHHETKVTREGNDIYNFGNSGRAIFGTQFFGSKTPSPAPQHPLSAQP